MLVSRAKFRVRFSRSGSAHAADMLRCHTCRIGRGQVAEILLGREDPAARVVDVEERLEVFEHLCAAHIVHGIEGQRYAGYDGPVRTCAPARGCPRCADGARLLADSRETDPVHLLVSAHTFVGWHGPACWPRVTNHMTSSRPGSKRPSDSPHLVLFFRLSGH